MALCQGKTWSEKRFHRQGRRTPQIRDWPWPHLLQNNDYKSGIKKTPGEPWRTCHTPTPQSRSLTPWRGGLSDAKVPSQEGTVPGRCEGQVGTPSPVQNVEGVRQCARVKTLLCHPNLLLLEGFCGSQRLLEGVSKGVEGRKEGVLCLNSVKGQVPGKEARGQGLG